MEEEKEELIEDYRSGVCEFVGDTPEEIKGCKTGMKKAEVGEDWFNGWSRGYSEWAMGEGTPATEVTEEFK